jgi:hypothetical protein
VSAHRFTAAAGLLSALAVVTTAAPARAQTPDPVTLHAVRLTQPLVVDGHLDDPVYRTTEPHRGFLQQEPRVGEPATEDTDMWIFFDDKNVYVSAWMHDSQPNRLVANDMRRDGSQVYQNDNFAVVLDTFHDRRTAFYFMTNPLGAVRDGLVIDENNTNYDWNTVWDVKTRRDETGWTTEMVIPFKSLRYRPERDQTWGINVRRWLRRTNEQSLLSISPPGTLPNGALQRLSAEATLVGIEAPAASRNIELKPYGVSNLTTNMLSSPPVSNAVERNVGIDAKYGITSNIVLDVTVHTDFAQVEIDEQQVNLTRFSLFFPEKRDFFLEGQGVFDFANTGARAGDVPIMFFSRRIGLDAGQPVPIQAGTRLTGRIGRTSVGLLEIRTDEGPGSLTPATNFAVTRIKRDVLRRSSIGLIATSRAPHGGGAASNQLVGVDASLNVLENIQAGSYYARSVTPRSVGDESSYRGFFRYVADRYGLEAERMKIGDAFNPGVGYVQRPDVQRTDVTARFSPRVRSVPGLRKLEWSAEYDRFVNGRGVLETGVASGNFRVDFNSSDILLITYHNDYEFLPVPFRIVRGVTLPVNSYTFNDAVVAYTIGPQRPVSGKITATAGEFYSGTRRQLDYAGSVKITSQFGLEPRVSVTRVALAEGAFTTTLGGSRIIYTITPRMFVSGLVQYNSTLNTLESNVRWRWEYRPGSDLFVVYTDGRDTFGPRSPQLMNRGLAIKATRLLRF